jgi:hypothetical protein
MSTTQPPYFDGIRKRAENRWIQLEADPELAAPWHQLFKQVQSPRHVISELLQNADDAEATEVSIQITDGLFTFDHNGHDFTADDFASLCRFGYSNKRLLRTIGFRGIGFKSTFSLGDTVGLRTPSLLVAFRKKRFTLPVWINGETTKNCITRVLVKIEDAQRQKELSNNMQEWLNSPFSLLFFNHIRKLKLGNQELHWKDLGAGPVPNSVWMGLQGQETPYLVVRSSDEPLPDDALKEIRDERLLDLGENGNLPPCKVEIVLGAPGDLFVVLPTGVKTLLPFAMNAPFIQDPARLKIKDPETSPTNRWLLLRIGQLAATSMLQWLQREDLDVGERAKAYDLLPPTGKIDNSLENICSLMVWEASVNTIQDKSFVLTDRGNLEMAKRCIEIPDALWEIWTSNQIVSILSARSKDPRLLSHDISQLNRQKLQKHHATLSIDPDEFLNILAVQTPPKPKAWSSLLTFWKLASQWNGFFWRSRDLNIYPVRGKSVLSSAKNVIRLSKDKLLQSEDDWDFLASHFLVLDANWLRYLTEQRRIATENNNKELSEKIDAADRVLLKTNLNEPSNLEIIIEQVAKTFFVQDIKKLAECVRFTQIAAKLNAKVGPSFRFWTKAGALRPVTEVLIFDETGKLEEFLPPNTRAHFLLHENYSHIFTSCSKDDWANWIRSGNAGIKTFIPINRTQKSINNKRQLEEEVKARGYTGTLEYRYITYNFQIEDWDFPTGYWNYWSACAKENPAIWSSLVEVFLRQPKSWEYARTAQAIHIATNRSSKSLTSNTLIPGWILRLRELPCLRDMHGNFRIPAELMRRTPKTEALLDAEPFVDGYLDNEAARPLLDLLGVRNTPTGPKQILERLRALAKAPKPPLVELIKWYQRLDVLFDDCTTGDQKEIKSIFEKECLIYAEDGSWQRVKSVFVTANENDAPGAGLIHSSASQLSLWRKIGVNERPTVELTIEWLKGLPSGEKLAPADARRVRVSLGRHPIRIWQVCGHWINLAGEWIPGDSLKYSLTMQSLIRWVNFHDWVKTQTADLQMLSVELTREPPFISWPSLASQVERRIEKPPKPGRRIALGWLQAVGKLLMRIQLDDLAQTARIRSLAARLAESEGRQVETLNVMPYLNGKPAGLPENESLAWVDNTLFITDIPKARLIRQIAETIGSIFDWPDLKVILAYGFERSEQDIRAYLSENFNLDPEETAPPVPDIKEKPALVQEIPPIIVKPESDESDLLETILKNIDEGTSTDNPPQPEDGNPHIEDQNPPHPTIPSPIRDPLIERFAVAHGFHKSGLHQFTDITGNILVKNEGVFPWLIQEAGGTVYCYYWVKEHCLQNKPLELPTEIWHLIEENPKQHALILEDTEECPVEMPGTDLLNHKENGTLKIFPATYRLTLELIE